jgi:molybdopterin synthase sulfur carrier subunit
MKVKFFAFFRDYTGCKEADVPPEASIRTLLPHLGDKYGKKLRDALLTKDGGLNPAAIIMVNGRHIQHLAGFDTPLKPDDTVQIFPIVAGG